jgi:hypothetical protein
MNAFHLSVVVGLVALLAWAAQFMGQPREPLMPGIKVVPAFVPVAKPQEEPTQSNAEVVSPSTETPTTGEPAPTTEAPPEPPADAWN